MEQGNQSSFNVVTTTKSGKNEKKGLIIGAIVVAVLAISIPVGVYLVKQQQDIREKAQEALACPAAEACPAAGEPTLLMSCYSLANGEAPDEVSCSTISNVGAITTCGGNRYCCPSLGSPWTTNVDLCAAISPTPTSTASITAITPTSTATASATLTATASATAKATSTATSSATTAPIPVTGTNWPTVLGVGVGILVIVGSVLLVL